MMVSGWQSGSAYLENPGVQSRSLEMNFCDELEEQSSVVNGKKSHINIPLNSRGKENEQ